VAEGENRFGDIVTGCLDGDIVVLLEVDTSVLLGRVIRRTKKLTLKTRVRWSRDMLAIAPLTVARASSMATATSRITVGIAIEIAVVVPIARPLALLLLGRIIGRSARSRTRRTSWAPAIGTWTCIVAVVTVLRFELVNSLHCNAVMQVE
jgi:hypothetical protein